MCVWMSLSFLSVAGRSVVEELHLEQREVEDGNSLEMAGLLYSHEGPLGLGGMEECGGVGARVAQRGHHTGCVRTGGLVKLRPLMMDQEADARTAAEEVWFSDKSLVKAREEQVEGGPSWAPLLQLETGVEGAQVE